MLIEVILKNYLQSPKKANLFNFYFSISITNYLAAHTAYFLILICIISRIPLTSSKVVHMQSISLFLICFYLEPKNIATNLYFSIFM